MESSGQATTHTMPCPMDQANQSPFGEKSTLHVSHPARPSKDGGRLVFSSRRRVVSGAEGRAGKKGNIHERANANILTRRPFFSPPLWMFLQAPPPPPSGYKHLHVAAGSAFFSVEHIVAVFTCSSSRSGGRSWTEAVGLPLRRVPDGLTVCFLLCDSPWTSGFGCPTSSR